MQVKPFLFTLSIAALTACSVDDNGHKQVDHQDADASKHDIRVVEQLNREALESKKELDETIAMPMQEQEAGKATTTSSQQTPIRMQSADKMVSNLAVTPESRQYLPTTPASGYIRYANEPLYSEKYQHRDCPYSVECQYPPSAHWHPGIQSLQRTIAGHQPGVPD